MVLKEIVGFLGQTAGWDYFTEREKHMQYVPLHHIVGKHVVDSRGVEKYSRGERYEGQTDILVLIKYRDRDVYTVLDGHHKFEAAYHSLYGKPGFWDAKVKASVISDNTGIMFHMVEMGLTQFGREFTTYVRPVLKHLAPETVKKFF